MESTFGALRRSCAGHTIASKRAGSQRGARICSVYTDGRARLSASSAIAPARPQPMANAQSSESGVGVRLSAAKRARRNRGAKARSSAFNLTTNSRLCRPKPRASTRACLTLPAAPSVKIQQFKFTLSSIVIGAFQPQRRILHAQHNDCRHRGNANVAPSATDK